MLAGLKQQERMGLVTPRLRGSSCFPSASSWHPPAARVPAPLPRLFAMLLPRENNTKRFSSEITVSERITQGFLWSFTCSHHFWWGGSLVHGRGGSTGWI